MLKRLRLKFIGTAVLAIFIVFALLTAGINLAFRAVTVRSLDGTLAMLAENEGAMPRIAAPPEKPEGQYGNAAQKKQTRPAKETKGKKPDRPAKRGSK